MKNLIKKENLYIIEFETKNNVYYYSSNVANLAIEKVKERAYFLEKTIDGLITIYYLDSVLKEYRKLVKYHQMTLGVPELC